MGRSTVRLSARIRAPLETVFERISDHEAMAEWPGVSRARLVKEGTPRNGLGAVRAITTGGLTIHEEIVFWDPPHGYDYTITKGLPVDHLGSVRLSESGDVVRLEWQVDVSSRIPLFARGVAMMIRRGLGAALRHFARETER